MNFPLNQRSEVLYMHLTNNWIGDHDIYQETRILKPCARRSELRQLGVEFIKKDVNVSNKFGREVSYAIFSIDNVKFARSIYDKINVNGRKERNK